MNVDCNILGNGSTISVLACAPRANRMHRRWYKQLQWTRIHLRSFVPTQLKFKDIVKYWWSGNILKQTNNRSSVHRRNYLFRLNESKAREKKPTTCCFGSRKQAMFSASSRFGSIRCPAGLRKGAGPIHGFRREKGLKSQSSAAPIVLPIDFDWTALMYLLSYPIQGSSGRARKTWLGVQRIGFALQGKQAGHWISPTGRWHDTRFIFRFRRG